MNVIELGRRITDRRWQIPVLYMTGGPADAIVAVEPVARKPFSMSTLVGIVERVLRGRRVVAAEPLLAASSGAG